MDRHGPHHETAETPRGDSAHPSHVPPRPGQIRTAPDTPPARPAHPSHGGTRTSDTIHWQPVPGLPFGDLIPTAPGVGADPQPTGSVLSFPDGNCWADVPADVSHLSSDAATIEAWINTSTTPDAYNGQVIYIGKGGDGAAPRLSIDAGSRIKLYWSGAGSHASGDTRPITDGTWHHVAVTIDAGTITFYKDGQPTTEPTPVTMPTGQPAGDPSQIGAGFGDATGFTGQIFDLRLWNKARTATQIPQLMYAAVDGTLTQQLSTLTQQGLLMATTFDAGRNAPVNLVGGATGDLNGCTIVTSPLPRPGYTMLRAAMGDCSLEIRTQVDPPPSGGGSRAVTVPGSIAIFLDGPAGQQELSAQRITVAADEASEITGAATVIAGAISSGLTRYFGSLAGAGGDETVAAAVEAASAAGSEEITASIGLEVAFGALAVVEVVGIAVAVAAAAVLIIEAIIQRRTHQLTIFNTTDETFTWQASYFYNARPSSVPQGVLPPKRTVEDDTSPIFGPVTYDLASSSVVFLQNVDPSKGIGYVLNFDSDSSPPFAVLGDIPVSGANSFLVQEGTQAGANWYQAVTGGDNPFQPNHALKQVRQQVQIGPRRLTLVNDQLTGNTHYGKYTGENYCSILYIE
jgi:hypothetical protein